MDEDDWTNEDKKRLAGICEEIRKDKKLNPRVLTIPCGRQESPDLPPAPFPFHPAHMFKYHCWAYLQEIFYDRLKRMDEKCDWATDHSQESAKTMFLTCVILWYKYDGGKDEITGLRWTVFMRHALCVSVGRALHVEPGSVMRTGWRTKKPTFYSEYDDNWRSITFETWFMNRAKSNFPVTPENIALFSELLLSVKQKSQYWKGYPREEVDLIDNAHDNDIEEEEVEEGGLGNDLRDFVDDDTGREVPERSGKENDKGDSRPSLPGPHSFIKPQYGQLGARSATPPPPPFEQLSPVLRPATPIEADAAAAASSQRYQQNADYLRSCTLYVPEEKRAKFEETIDELLAAAIASSHLEEC
ncbi:hypothetical protein E8E11_008438 [Didymella keratinophila]|nr:hypothetical protein E8E11_008438 [Didymella keratinophila]